MKVLLTTIGSSGDINPFIALAIRLRDEGHEPVLLVNPYFQETVERAGIAYAPYGAVFSPLEVAQEHPLAFSRVLGAWVLFRHIFRPLMDEMYDGVRSAVRDIKPDVIVGHQISFGLPWVAQQSGIPWATCPLAPATVLSAHDPSRMPIGNDLTKMPMWYRRLAIGAIRNTVALSFDGAYNKKRRAIGIKPRRDTLFGEMLSGDAVIAMWSPAWRSPAPDDLPTMTICGFPWFDGNHAGLEPDLDRFLEDGEPPIVFTFGSVLSHTGQDAYAQAVRTCEILGKRGVLVTGHEGSAPSNLPPSIMRLDHAPYSALFPRAAAVVHHGGVGTTAQGLRAGVPTIIMPHAHDQFDNAARCQRHGVSRTVRRHRVQAKNLAQALDKLLGDDQAKQRAMALGKRIRAEDGVGAAVRVIEGIAR